MKKNAKQPWTRAWTFQEECLAGENMELLIRQRSVPGVCIASPLADIEGEVHVSATQFRDRATNFLLDLINKKTTSAGLQETCGSLLRTFRKHRLLEQATPSANGRSTTASMFEDLGCRDVTAPYDLLPIAANVCDYFFRLRSDELAKSSHSVGLCALTMYVSNGEIFCNSERVCELPTEMSLSKYIKHISFAPFAPPLGELRLSWLKQCRLRPALMLLKEGILTSGHLWHVYESIRVPSLGHVPDLEDHSGRYGLGARDRNRLLQLIDKLKQLSFGKDLCEKLGEYLKVDGELQDPPAWSMDYMNQMAGVVLEAIESGRSLYLAAHRTSPKACAVFVKGADEDARSGSEAKPQSDEHEIGRTCSQSEIDFQSGPSESFGVVEENFCVFASSSAFHHVSM
jgi:hypothetical protein